MLTLGAKLTLDDAMFRAALGASGKQTQRFGTLVGAMGLSIDRAERTLKSATSALVGYGLAFAGATVGLNQTISGAVELDRGLTKIGTLMGSRSGAIEKFGGAVRQMSLDFGIGVNDINEAMYQAMSAGIAQESAVEFTRAMAKAAKGGFTDMTTVVDGATSVLNAYGISAGKTEQVLDVLFASANIGKTSIEELSRSLGNIVSTSAATGVSIEEVAAVMATSTSAGIKTAEAVTALRQSLAAVIKPSGEARKVAERLGVDFSTTGLKAEGLAGFMREVSEAAGDDQEALATLFGSVEAFNLVLSITGKKAADFERNLASMRRATGTMDRQFEQVGQSTGHHIDRIKTSFSTMTRDVGVMILNRYGGSIEKLPAKIEAAIPKVKKAVGQFLTIAEDVVKGLLEMLEVMLVGKGLGLIGKFAAGVGGALSQAKTATGAGAAAGAATGAAGVLGKIATGTLVVESMVLAAAAAAALGEALGGYFGRKYFGDNESLRAQLDMDTAKNVKTMVFGNTEGREIKGYAEFFRANPRGFLKNVPGIMDVVSTGYGNENLLRQAGYDPQDKLVQAALKKLQSKLFGELAAETSKQFQQRAEAPSMPGLGPRMLDPTMVDAFIDEASKEAMKTVLGNRTAVEEQLTELINQEKRAREKAVKELIAIQAKVDAVTEEVITRLLAVGPIGTAVKAMTSASDSIRSGFSDIGIKIFHQITDKDRKRGHSIAARASRGDGTARHLNARYRAVVLRTGEGAGVIEPLAENYHRPHLLNPEG